MQHELLELLLTSPPACTPKDAEDIAVEYFGRHVHARMLASERDQNFRLDTDDGQRYVLKISNHAEQARVVDFQNDALRHIAEHDATLPVPRVIAGLDGRFRFTVNLYDRSHIVRLLNWLDGDVLYGLPPGSERAGPLAAQLGALLARLGLALRGFDHAGSNPPSLWDMKRAGALVELLEFIKDERLRKLIEKVLARFHKLLPTLLTLRTQVIYNDLNPDNVLLEKNDPSRITGIIDFGDLVKSPLVIDLAIASAYQLADAEDPLAGALPLIAGYHALRPLRAMEMELLPDLIRTRLVTSILIMSWRMQRYPQNRDYLVRSQAPFRHCLNRLAGMDTGLAHARIQAACSHGVNVEQ